MRLLVEHVGEADGDEAADDEEHAEPLEPGQTGAEEDRREDAREDDHSPSQHLRNLYRNLSFTFTKVINYLER